MIFNQFLNILNIYLKFKNINNIKNDANFGVGKGRQKK